MRLPLTAAAHGRVRAWRPTVRIYRLSVAALVFFVSKGRAYGQSDTTRDFSTVTIRAGTGPLRTDDRLARFYTPGAALTLEAASPFQSGELAATVSRAKYASVGAVHPNFTSLTASLAWRYLISNRVVAAGAGVHFGATQFAFRDTVIDPGQRDEREVLMGVNALLSLRLASGLSAFAEGSYSHIWLHVPVHVAGLTAGLSLTTPTPAWLREFLR